MTDKPLFVASNRTGGGVGSGAAAPEVLGIFREEGETRMTWSDVVPSSLLIERQLGGCAGHDPLGFASHKILLWIAFVSAGDRPVWLGLQSQMATVHLEFTHDAFPKSFSVPS